MFIIIFKIHISKIDELMTLTQAKHVLNINGDFKAYISSHTNKLNSF